MGEQPYDGSPNHDPLTTQGDGTEGPPIGELTSSSSSSAASAATPSAPATQTAPETTPMPSGNAS